MPNWKEAFEQVLAKGGETAGNFSKCRFCQIVDVDNTSCPDKCGLCPIFAVDSGGYSGPCSNVFGPDKMRDSERCAICRHVLATVKDFTDRDEIRARVAEMLDDPEKFLGKPEPEKPGWCNCCATCDAAYSNDGGMGRDHDSYPRLTEFVQGRLNGKHQTRAGFQSKPDAQRFLDALPEEEK